ncbi:MAG: MarR family transcriptional regulator [Candidatus Hydrothermarchaeales archaeon]
MKKLLLLLLLLLLLSPALVHATQLRSYKILAEIKGGIVHEELLISLFNDGQSELISGSITAPISAEIVSIRDTYGQLGYQIQSDGIQTMNFNFSIPIHPGEERLVIASIKAPLITQKEEYSEYLLVFTPKQNISDFEHVLKLPKNAELYSPRESFSMVVPEGKISEEPSAITLTWRMGLKANEPTVFLVRYRVPAFPWEKLAYALFALGSLLAGAFLGNKFWIRRKRAKTIKSLKILNERERFVLEEIIKNEGIKQRELIGKLGYTKSSLSKILSKLEARGLIRKVKSGKVNRLYPGEKIR